MSDQNQHLPIYSLIPDKQTGNKNFRVYNFEGTLPDEEDLLVPHRKNHFLIALVRKGGTRQWLDMNPYTLKDNTIYFYVPNRIIVKEGADQLWSTGIAFTKEFLSFQENAALSNLPILKSPQGGHELLLNEGDIAFVEDILNKIKLEYATTSEWQQRMLNAYMTVFLTYLSRLYTEQFKLKDTSSENILLQQFQEKINQHFREMREVSEYASMLNISSGHLSEVVKAQSGKPAIKHIHERLVLEARRLLFHSANSLKEIAFDLGFSDASYFNRFFKRETGSTPLDYRTKTREMYH